MKFGIKHVAIAAALALGALSATPATVQAQGAPPVAPLPPLTPALQIQLNAALTGTPAQVQQKLQTLLQSLPPGQRALVSGAARARTAGNPALAGVVNAVVVQQTSPAAGVPPGGAPPGGAPPSRNVRRVAAPPPGPVATPPGPPVVPVVPETQLEEQAVVVVTPAPVTP